MIKIVSKNYGPIYLPIETIVREFDSKLVLTANALCRGYAVIFGRKSSVKNAAISIKRGLYLYKDHGQISSEPLFDFLSQHGIESCALDEEGLVFFTPDWYVQSRIGNKSVFDALTKVFVWGDEQKNILQNYFDNLNSKIIKTGNPRFDLLRFPLQKLYFEQKVKIKARYSPFVLINTRFAPGNFAHFYRMSYIEYRYKLGIIKSYADEQFCLGMMQYWHEQFRSYIKMIQKLSEALKEINIIIRPHPSEEHSTWLEQLSDLSNVHVISEGNAINWILASKAVIHTGCTTGIEAFASGKPVLRYHPRYDSRFEPPLPNKFGESFTIVDSLIDRVQKVCFSETNYSPDEEQMKLLKHYVENVTGPFAYERILDFFDSIMMYGPDGSNNIENINISKTCKDFLKMKITKFSRNHTRFLFAAFGQELSLRLQRRTQKFSGLTKHLVEERLNKIFEISPNLDNPGFSLKEIDTDTFIITPAS